MARSAITTRTVSAVTLAGILFHSAAFAGSGIQAASTSSALATGAASKVAAATAPVATAPAATPGSTLVTVGNQSILTAYSVQELPLDFPAGMGDGIVVGTVDGVASAYVNGQVFPLPGKAGYTNIVPTAISSNGYIVGYGHSGTNDRGLFWTSYTSSPIDMGGLGAITHPQSVNSSGVSVGEYFASSVYDLPQAFAFSLSSGIRSIAPPYSNQSDAYRISDSGYVGGFAWYGLQQAATRWYPGTFVAGTVAYSSFAWGALNNGTVFGYVTSWNLSDQATNIAPNTISLVYDISDNGRKVGTNIFTTTIRAWTVPSGGTAAQILPVPAGAVSTYAIQVNDCGTILGYAAFADGSTKAVIWSRITCDFSAVLTQ